MGIEECSYCPARFFMGWNIIYSNDKEIVVFRF